MLIPLLKLVKCFSMPDNIVSTGKLFLDHIPIFSTVKDTNISPDDLNKNPQKISDWFYRWKCHLILTKKVIFFRKLNKSNHPKIYFNNAPVFSANWQKHLGIYLDESLNISYHIKEKMSKAMKRIGIIRKLNKALPQHSLITIYK